MSPILGIYASQVSGKLWPASSYESIQTTTLGSGTSSVTLSSIPQTYTHLQLRVSGAANANVFLRFNGGTSGYSWHRLMGDGSSASATGVPNEFSMYVMYPPSNSYPLTFISDILDYTDTNKYKVVRSLAGIDQNGSGRIEMTSGSYRNTSAISSITIYSDGGTFSTNTSFALYGIKGVA